MGHPQPVWTQSEYIYGTLLEWPVPGTRLLFFYKSNEHHNKYFHQFIIFLSKQAFKKKKSYILPQTQLW